MTSREVIFANHISHWGQMEELTIHPANLLNYPTPLGRSASIPMLTDPFALTGCGFQEYLRSFVTTNSWECSPCHHAGHFFTTGNSSWQVRLSPFRSLWCEASTSITACLPSFLKFHGKTHGNSLDSFCESFSLTEGGENIIITQFCQEEVEFSTLKDNYRKVFLIYPPVIYIFFHH